MQTWLWLEYGGWRWCGPRIRETPGKISKWVISSSTSHLVHRPQANHMEFWFQEPNICAYIWLPRLSGPTLKAKATKPQTSQSTCLLTSKGGLWLHFYAFSYRMSEENTERILGGIWRKWRKRHVKLCLCPHFTLDWVFWPRFPCPSSQGNWLNAFNSIQAL